MNLRLVSFKTCPYAQRVRAALNYLNVPFESVIIEADNKPEWFAKASPLEKVPILFVGETVLFESLVILDYVSTLSQKHLIPADNLQRALNRARAEFAGEIIGTFWGIFNAQNEEAYKGALADLKWYFEKLEGWLNQSTFIFNNELTFADFAYTSLFTLLAAVKPLLKVNVFEGFPKLQHYSETLLALPAVQHSKVEHYEQLVQERVKGRNGYILKI